MNITETKVIPAREAKHVLETRCDFCGITTYKNPPEGEEGIESTFSSDVSFFEFREDGKDDMIFVLHVCRACSYDRLIPLLNSIAITPSKWEKWD